MFHFRNTELKRLSESIRRKLYTGRQPIVNRVVAWKATDWSKFGKDVKQVNQLACIRCPNAQEAPNAFLLSQSAKYRKICFEPL